MKKVIKSIFLVCLSILMMIPTVAFGAEEEIADWEDIILSQEEFERIVSPYEKSNSYARTTGLIQLYAIAIEKSGSNLIIAGKTYCTGDVVKCGFTEVKIQRRKNSSYSWSNYLSYSDMYDNDFSYVFPKKLTPATGYQYRVTCTHYAKKNILSTEKISNTSNIVTM